MTDNNKSFDDLMKLIKNSVRGPRPTFAAPPDRRMMMDTLDLIQHEFKSRQKIASYLIETVLNPEFEKLEKPVKEDILKNLVVTLGFSAMLNMAQALGVKGSNVARQATDDFGALTVKALRDSRRLIDVLVPKEPPSAAENNNPGDH